MRLYRGQLPTIVDEMAKALIDANHIEVETDSRAEFLLDLEAVLKEYMRLQRDINERAKDMVSSRNLDYSQLTKVRQELSEKKGMGQGDKSMDWLLTQLTEVLLHSKNVEEVFAEDHTLRKTIRDVLRRYADVDKELDRQVRTRIKNLQEGTANWEVEYQRELEGLKTRQRLE